MEFLIHCPPDLPPKSRVVSVCGITDWDNAASPKEDGWLMSDFYLFRHLLSSLAPTNQTWLTSEDPIDLFRKYKEYAYGNPQERRVVLDGGMLDKSLSNIRVVPRRSLLVRFLDTIREQAQIAKREHEQLFILIFSHGDFDASGVLMGGDGYERAPLLSMGDINRRLPKGLSVTLLMSSCYYGGWLVRTDIASNGKDKDLQSWRLSRMVCRASSSLIASALLICLINDEGLEDGALEDRYHELGNPIFESIKGMHFLGEEQQMRFSPENDEWELHHKRRVGLPLAFYKARWESLREIPPTAAAGVAGIKPFWTKNARRYRRLQALARQYLAANPGLDNAGPNIALHGRLKSILRGGNFTESILDTLFDTVAYRLGSMHEAEYVRTQMGVDFPSIFDVDVLRWKASNWSACTPQDRSSKDELYRKLHGLIRDNRVFTRQIRGGLTYAEPTHYLALALTESGLEWEEIENRLKEAYSQKKRWYRSTFEAWRDRPRPLVNQNPVEK